MNSMINKEINMPFGWKLCQYWPAEIILKNKSRKHGIYIKAPWYLWNDMKRWESKDGTFVLEDSVSLIDERGFRTLSIRDWPEARTYLRRFTYTTKYGELQTATLTAYRERIRDVLWCLRWLPFAGRDRDRLQIEFDDEMGSERGSWKGGVVGTSLSMRAGETVEQALDRVLADAQERHWWDR